MDNVESLLKKLISVPSETGNELIFCDFLFDYLTEVGYNPIKIPVDDNGYNIVVSEGNPNVYLAAHMDTVTPYIPYSEDLSSIYGRGSCDTKGSIAAMLTAGLQAKQAGQTNYGFIFTVGEESNFRGANKIITTNLPLPFVVVGEPTSLDIVNGHFGILIISLNATGKAAHSSTPEKGINAIDLLLEGLRKIKTELEIYPESLMSLVKINGGRADNIIPDNAQAILSFRISPHDKTLYLTQIKQLIKPEISATITQSYPSIYNDVPDNLAFIPNHRSVAYMTELSMFKKGVVIGPGDITYAHTSNEHIAKRELQEAVKVYTTILKNYCN